MLSFILYVKDRNYAQKKGVCCALSPGGFLYVAGFVFMIAILVAMLLRSNIAYLIISVVGALLFSAYLLFDLQLIMGGR